MSIARQVGTFCVPPNPKLLAYWDRVADRLFKLRNCLDLQGQRRELPLFAPPIDPLLLARMRAAGLPAHLSSDAGRYLCNAVLFHALTLHAGSRMPGQAGFIHIPEDLGSARWPRLPIRRRLPLDLERTVAGASIALSTCLARRVY